MQTITSRKNPRITHMKKLGASREYRQTQGEFLCDGFKLLQEAVDYIDWKQQLYDDILSGKQEYHSDLVPTEE